MNRPRVRARRLAVLGLLALLPLALVLGLATTTAGPAQAASASNWNAGNIIADSVFFNTQTMSQAGVQAFLQAKEPSCASGYTCLKSYTQDTWTRAADAQCASYAGVPGEPASAIIWKTAQVCGVNPMVLLVLLQKESSLVTASAPSSGSYLHATGYGCPDTAPCDSQYYGFYNQVYKAAWQYKKYTNNPTNYSYQAGRNNYVQWNPNSGCGGSTVYIQNKATAALYIYTPYQPNTAALNNLYGTGDSCSAYGNRNFWRMFTDWFGSTQTSFSVVGPILTEYDTWGDSSGALGDAIANQYPTAGGGQTQMFQRGGIHWSPATGARAVLGPIAANYDGLGGEGGALGYPVTEQYATVGSGLSQVFQNGGIHWSPATGAHAVIGAIATMYDATGGESGYLGYPTAERYPTANGGWTQPFQHGRVHWSAPTGAHDVSGAIGAVYDGMLGEGGVLGYPITDQYGTVGGGAAQLFENGGIHWTAGTGAHAVIGDVATAYDAMGGESGPLGYPIGDRYATPNAGWTQAFQNGRIHFSPATGAHAVLPPISAPYNALTGESGRLGYPTDDAYAGSAGGVAQPFQNGTLVVGSDGTARTVEGVLGTAYAALGGAAGPLGEPTAGVTGLGPNASGQTFTGGRLLDGPATSPHAVVGAVATAYAAAGGQTGVLGWPTAEQTTGASGSTVQQFENGLLVVSGGTSRLVLGDIAATWKSLGGSTGVLGNPTGDRTATAAGYQQAFTGGLVVTGASTGTRAVIGNLATALTAAGGPDGVLGYPTSDRYPTPGSGWTQLFQNGGIHSSPATGAHAVTGPLAAAYDALAGESGALGYPIGDQSGSPSTGLWQRFEHGRISWTPALGAHTVIGSIAGAYDTQGDEAGLLGWPTSDRYATPGNGWTQAFQNGRIHYSPTTGAHPVIAPISSAYDALRGESGVLGYPTSDRYATPNGGWTQAFQNGRIHTSPSTGAHAVLAPLSGEYDALRGESGVLGYPTSDRYATVGGGWTQAFQNGRIHYSPGTGAHAVIAPISASYDAVRGESGPLGYPTADQVVAGNGVVTQTFQNGTITQNPGTSPAIHLR